MRHTPPGDMIFGTPAEWSDYVAAHNERALLKVNSWIGKRVKVLDGEYADEGAHITGVTADRGGLLFTLHLHIVEDDLRVVAHLRPNEIDWSQ